MNSFRILTCMNFSNLFICSWMSSEFKVRMNNFLVIRMQVKFLLLFSSLWLFSDSLVIHVIILNGFKIKKRASFLSSSSFSILYHRKDFSFLYIPKIILIQKCWLSDFKSNIFSNFFNAVIGIKIHEQKYYRFAFNFAT